MKRLKTLISKEKMRLSLRVRRAKERRKKEKREKEKEMEKEEKRRVNEKGEQINRLIFLSAPDSDYEPEIREVPLSGEDGEAEEENFEEEEEEESSDFKGTPRQKPSSLSSGHPNANTEFSFEYAEEDLKYMSPAERSLVLEAKKLFERERRRRQQQGEQKKGKREREREREKESELEKGRGKRNFDLIFSSSPVRDVRKSAPRCSSTRACSHTHLIIECLRLSSASSPSYAISPRAEERKGRRGR
jgi:hypothetical protein